MARRLERSTAEPYNDKGTDHHESFSRCITVPRHTQP